MNFFMRTSCLRHELMPGSIMSSLTCRTQTTVLPRQNLYNFIHRCSLRTLTGPSGYKLFNHFSRTNIVTISSFYQRYSCKMRLNPECLHTSFSSNQSFCGPSSRRNGTSIQSFSPQKNSHHWNSVLFSNHNQSLFQKYLNGLMCTTDFHREFSLSPKSVLDASPPSLQPYLKLIRFDKPIGTALLFWPCSWSIAMASLPGHFPSLFILSVFGTGAFLMRGAGCIINDMWDRDFDRQVERTKLRPLASGELNYFQALSLLGVVLSGSLGLLLTLNNYTVLLGASSMILVILYPLAKRYTNWPQLMLGVTLNWGVLMAWSALHGSLEAPVIPLYLACVLYTIFYDTIYSHQDKYDDMFIGVKSTALHLGDNTKPWLTSFSVAMVGLMSMSGYLNDQTWPFYLGVAGIAVHLARQVYTVDLNDADSCAKKFISNNRLGFLVLIGIVLGTLLKNSPEEKENISSDS